MNFQGIPDSPLTSQGDLLNLIEGVMQIIFIGSAVLLIIALCIVFYLCLSEPK